MTATTFKAKIIKDVSPRKTLLSIPIGQTMIIKTCIIKSGTIRATITKLNKEGYSFESSERGLINEIKIKRIK